MAYRVELKLSLGLSVSNPLITTACSAFGPASGNAKHAVFWLTCFMELAPNMVRFLPSGKDQMQSFNGFTVGVRGIYLLGGTGNGLEKWPADVTTLQGNVTV